MEPALAVHRDRLFSSLEATMGKALANASRVSDNPNAGALLLCSAAACVGSIARSRASEAALPMAERLLVATLRAAVRGELVPINEDGTVCRDAVLVGPEAAQP